MRREEETVSYLRYCLFIIQLDSDGLKLKWIYCIKYLVHFLGERTNGRQWEWPQGLVNFAGSLVFIVA
jgi:hypothetical protein